MKRLRKLTAFLTAAAILSVGGCANTATPQSNGGNEESDKLTLYWMSESRPKNISYFNRLLEEKGYDFQVEFLCVENTDNNYEFVEAAQEYREKQTPVDILEPGYVWVENYRRPYLEFAKGGMYLPLNDYLNTEGGKKVWDVCEERVWDRLKIDGSYYAIPKNHLYARPSAIVYRSDLAEQYSIDPQVFQKDISEWEPALRTIQQKVQTEGFYAMECPYDFSTFLGRYHYTEPYELGVGIVADESTDVREVINFYETEAAEHLWSTVRSYIDKGYMPETCHEQNTRYFSFSSLLMTDSQAQENASDFGGGTWKSEIYTGDIYMNGANEANVLGIASWSAHPEETFELITAVMTDAELSNALVWGELETDYIEMNGRRYLTNGGYPPDFEANYMLIEPMPTEPVEKKELYPQLMKRAITPKTADFHFDGTAVKDEIDAVSKVYNDLGSKGIFLQTLDEVNQQMKNAGIDQIIDEYNRQLAQWDQEQAQK